MARTQTRTFKNLIGGEQVDAASGETFESLNPATGEVIGSFPKSGPEDVDRAACADARWRPWASSVSLP